MGMMLMGSMWRIVLSIRKRRELRKEDMNFVDWLDRQTYAERVELMRLWKLDNRPISYEDYLKECYEKSKE